MNRPRRTTDITGKPVFTIPIRTDRWHSGQWVIRVYRERDRFTMLTLATSIWATAFAGCVYWHAPDFWSNITLFVACYMLINAVLSGVATALKSGEQ